VLLKPHQDDCMNSGEIRLNFNSKDPTIFKFEKRDFETVVSPVAEDDA
jgi:hypothetical protein